MLVLSVGNLPLANPGVYTTADSVTVEDSKADFPRLNELGVEILWFMPIHPISEKNRVGSLGSYYAVDDYQVVNPEFGSIEDFESLVDTAHEMGFKVVLDWVANHTGWDNEWTENEGWYTTDTEGNIVIPQGTNWRDVANLNFGNADMRNAMIGAMKYWVRELDVDGFRADYAAGVPQDFWETA
jgi:glycosidase